MQLQCPRCGETTDVGEPEGFACGRCGGWVKVAPNGKAWMLQPCARALPGEAEALRLCDQADKVADPVRKKELLDQAAAKCPDSLTVQAEKLHLGRLWQRDPRRMDYHVVKCYLLHVFEDPDAETPQMRRAMLAELTGDAQLMRCLALAEEPEAFLREYLTRLCREYVRIFLKGSAAHGGRFMGLQVVRLERSLARPVARMLDNMERASLPAPYDTLLPECLLTVFRADVGSDAYVQAAREEMKA